MRAGWPRAARSALPAAATSRMARWAASRRAGSDMMVSVDAPPATTQRPLKGMFQPSFSQRALSREGSGRISTLEPCQRATASASCAGSSPWWPRLSAPNSRWRIWPGSPRWTPMKAMPPKIWRSGSSAAISLSMVRPFIRAMTRVSGESSGPARAGRASSPVALRPTSSQSTGPRAASSSGVRAMIGLGRCRSPSGLERRSPSAAAAS